MAGVGQPHARSARPVHGPGGEDHLERLHEPHGPGKPVGSPEPRTIPRLVSGRPRWVFGLSDTRRQVQARASSRPPPTAAPSITAREGNGRSSSVFKTSCPDLYFSSAARASRSASISWMSAPVMNDPGLPLLTMRQRRSDLRESAESIPASSSITAARRKLSFSPGRSKTSSAIPSRSVSVKAGPSAPEGAGPSRRLQEQGSALPAPDAEGRKPEVLFPSAQLLQHVDDESRARHPHGMAKGDGAPLRIQAAAVKIPQLRVAAQEAPGNSSEPNARSQAITWAANASLSSMYVMSFMVTPERSRRRLVAYTGPRPISLRGVYPTGRQRCSGKRECELRASANDARR